VSVARWYRRPLPARSGAGVALAALLALGALSCGGSGDRPDSEASAPLTTAPLADEGDPTPGGTLVMGIDAESNGWDPARSNFAMAGSMVASAIYDTLLAFDENRELVPNLAESVTPNADGTVWTIRVRDGVVFHDGTPFDAAAVKQNIDARLASPIASRSLQPVREAVVVDDRTVEVRMNTPWFGYDYTLAAQGGFMAAPATLTREDGPSKPVGTGPFRFVSWTPGSSLRVERNPDYWKTDDAGTRLPYLDAIEFRVLTDPKAREAALRAGDVQMIQTSSVESIRAFQGLDGYDTVVDLANFEVIVMLNQGKPPFDNDDARRAVVLATDQQAVVEIMGAGVLEAATGPFSANERWFVADTGYPAHDPEAARQAVEAYKAATGAPELAFTLRATAGDDVERVATILQEQWAQVGIRAEVVPVEQSSYINEVVVGNYEAAMFRQFSYVFPDSNYIFWHSSTAAGPGQVSINFTQTRVPALDAALDAARSTDDRDELLELYATAQRELNAELPYVWLYHQAWALLAQERVNGLGPAASGGFARTDGKPWWSEVWIASG
jgi:ABC-type transport system substrate-binding protein